MIAQRNADDFVKYLNGVSRQLIQLLDIETPIQIQTNRDSVSVDLDTRNATQQNSSNRPINATTNRKIQNSRTRYRSQWISPTQTAQRKSRSFNSQASRRASRNDSDKSGNEKSASRIYKSDTILKQSPVTTHAGKGQHRRKSARSVGVKPRFKTESISHMHNHSKDDLTVRQMMSNDSGGQQNQSPTSSSSSSPATSSTLTTLAASDSSPIKAFATRDNQALIHSSFNYSPSKRDQEACQLKHQQQSQSSDISAGVAGNHSNNNNNNNNVSSNNGLESTTDTHTIEDRLTLSITDDISVLDHASSISPPTHLSPLDPTVPSAFGTSGSGGGGGASGGSLMLHQPYYSTPLRVSHQVDSCSLADEFHANSSSQDHITVPAFQIHDHHDQQINLNQRQQQQQQHQDHHRLNEQQRHQAEDSRRTMTVMGRGSEIIDGPILVNSVDRCYANNDHPHVQNHLQHTGTLAHLHQHSHYNNPLDHHQQHQQAHAHHQHQSDHHRHHHWFLPATTQPNDSSFQMGSGDACSIVEPTIAPPLSPATHQSLDQVHFGAPLYQHSYYNNQQGEHLNSFQHVADDYASANTLAASSSSPISHLTLRSEHRAHDSSIQTTHTSCLNSLDVNGSSTNTNYNQHQSHSHHHSHHHETQHHQQQMQQHIQDSQQHVVSQRDDSHALMDSSPYNSAYDSQRHVNNQYQQHHQHHLLPLINGIEPNAVILQDINLASATWSSPEDLYSI